MSIEEESKTQLETESIPPEQQQQLQQSFVFAAIIDIAGLINKMLWEGGCDLTRMKMYTKSLFVFDSSNLIKAYPPKQMAPALEQMYGFLSGRDGQARKLYPTVAQIIKLSRYLRKDPALLNEVRDKIYDLNKGLNARTRTQTSTILQISDIYSETLSKLPQRNRIKISGSSKYVNNPNVAKTVRTLLLASVRAALTWHYLGGRSWHLVLARKRMLAASESLIVKTSS